MADIDINYIVTVTDIDGQEHTLILEIEEFEDLKRQLSSFIPKESTKKVKKNAG